MMLVVRRLLHVVVLATFVGQASGAIPPVENHDCEQTCPGDESDDDCAPQCHMCTCCSSVRLTISLVSANPVPGPMLGFLVWASDENPPSPEPREIFHVPKRFHA